MYHAGHTSFVRDAARGAVMGVYFGPPESFDRIYIHFTTPEKALALRDQINTYLKEVNVPPQAS